MPGEKHCLHILIAVIIALVVTACASMGRPEGGPRDIDPPLFVRSNPSPGETNVNNQKIVIEFNENVQLKDIMSKVVISPAQQVNPLINANGRRITVELRDTMLPNTTYTLDFSDAISDLNEGNEIDGFAFAFSTGETIDSLQISGMVLEAETLEPAQGMLVGVYSNLSDTALTTLPFERITRTNQYGQYTIRNLKEGNYRIYAINDQNRDFHWDRSEDIAFYDMIITPTAHQSTHSDTLKAEDGSDSIVAHTVTEFGPNDILLTWFNEKYSPQYLLKYERPEDKRIYLEFATQSDTLPVLTLLNGKYAGESLGKYIRLNASSTLDSLEYWLTDSVLIGQDSIMLEARYLRTDTLDKLSWTTDTLSFNLRANRNKNNNNKKDNKDNDTIPPEINYLSLRVEGSNTQDIHLPFYISAAVPIASFDTTGVHLEILEDTIWIELIPPTVIQYAPERPMRFIVDYPWEPGAKYRFLVDSAAVTDAYGSWNKSLKHEFTVRKESDYSSITFNITGLSAPGIVQLLNSGDKPIAAQAVENGKAVFTHLMPNTYYARLFEDRNDNGKYDNGVVADSIQPEDMYYYPKKIPLKANWDAVQTWDINELPLDMQKPSDIKKNKPKKKAGEMPEEEEEEEDDNQFYAPGSIDDRLNRTNNRKTNRSNRNTGRFRQNNMNGF